ncbi:MAG TPA: diphthine--ammonia ligase [Rhizomicrobium sp.]
MSGDQSVPSSEKPVLVSWSGGKDSCLALYEIRKMRPVEALLTTVTREFDRISMHGVRRVLLEKQAESLGLPLRQVQISRGATNDEYEASMGAAFAQYRGRGIESVVFGDLFLADIRAYRDRLLARHHMKGIYPLWGRDTARLIRDFLALGFKTAVVCVDPAKLDRRFVGRMLDEQFLSELPGDVDPCGENGEFHTFVFDGPDFRRPIGFSFGEIVLRDRFWFADLIPDA